MKHDTQTFRRGINPFMLIISLAVCAALMSAGPAHAQQRDASQGDKSEAQSKAGKDDKNDEQQPSGASSKRTRASVVAQRTGERDPFNKYRVIINKGRPKNVPQPIEPPSIQARIERYKEQKRVAMNLQQPAPKPTTALLLSEMQVIGIFRTPRGYAAMVEATPIKLSYTIYPGERFFNGQLVAIEEDRLVFRRETRWTDGRLAKAVETKPLRQPSIVADPLAAAAKESGNASKDSGASPSGQSAGKAEEKAASPQNQ